MNQSSKVLVTGHNGLVGSAMVLALRERGYSNVMTWARSEIDLGDPVAVRYAFSVYEPEYVFHCAAKVGGIKVNSENPVQFFLQNVAIQNNVLGEACRYHVRKLVFLGSSCIYPRDCPQPIREEYLLTGPLETTNEAYALAKISGVKLCQWYRKERGCDFVAAMPCNLYGPGDYFHPEDAHIVPGLIARMHAAKVAGEPVFKVWGDGTQQREILYSDDLARGLITVMRGYDRPEPINVGSGDEYRAIDLAKLVAEAVGYAGAVLTDPTKPTGTLRKFLDNQKISDLGWAPGVPIETGLRLTYGDFLRGPRK